MSASNVTVAASASADGGFAVSLRCSAEVVERMDPARARAVAAQLLKTADVVERANAEPAGVGQLRIECDPQRELLI